MPRALSLLIASAQTRRRVFQSARPLRKFSALPAKKPASKVFRNELETAPNRLNVPADNVSVEQLQDTPKHVQLHISASNIETIRVPITIADIFLRKEHLPFAYFFKEKLDPVLLRDALESTLKSGFGVAAGRIAECYTAIECKPTDTIPFTIQTIDDSMENWTNMGHCHQNQDPVLNPLFEELGSHHYLLSVKVTYFKDGCCLGVNMSHALADTAACVEFVASWGRAMSSLAAMDEPARNNEPAREKPANPPVSWDRSKASVTGMMTTDMADLLQVQADDLSASVVPATSSLFPAWLSSWLDGEKQNEPRTASSSIPHEYVSLKFSAQVLKALKAHAMENSKTPVSTNDLVTAVGWLWKRHLSGLNNHRISTVVNLRGRSGVGNFAYGGHQTSGEDMSSIIGSSSGLFGNAITNVVADLPASSKITVNDPASINLAAQAIRQSLIDGLAKIPDRLANSRLNQRVMAADSRNSFSTTSWGQLSPWNIRFGGAAVESFHGQPIHPVFGETKASVIHSSLDGGCVYDLFLPSHKAAEARELHAELCRIYLNLSTKTNHTAVPNV